MGSMNDHPCAKDSGGSTAAPAPSPYAYGAKSPAMGGVQGGGQSMWGDNGSWLGANGVTGTGAPLQAPNSMQPGATPAGTPGAGPAYAPGTNPRNSLDLGGFNMNDINAARANPGSAIGTPLQGGVVGMRPGTGTPLNFNMQDLLAKNGMNMRDVMQARQTGMDQYWAQRQAANQQPVAPTANDPGPNTLLPLNPGQPPGSIAVDPGGPTAGPVSMPPGTFPPQPKPIPQPVGPPIVPYGASGIQPSATQLANTLRRPKNSGV